MDGVPFPLSNDSSTSEISSSNRTTFSSIQSINSSINYDTGSTERSFSDQQFIRGPDYEMDIDRPHQNGAPQKGKGRNEAGANCDECGRWFFRRHDLQRHQDTVHSDLKYACGSCLFQSIARKDKITEHIKRKHWDKATAEKIAICIKDGCRTEKIKGTVFATQARLKEHESWVHAPQASILSQEFKPESLQKIDLANGKRTAGLASAPGAKRQKALHQLPNEVDREHGKELEKLDTVSSVIESSANSLSLEQPPGLNIDNEGHNNIDQNVQLISNVKLAEFVAISKRDGKES